MNITTTIILVVVVLLIIATAAIYYFKKRNLTKLFEQVYVNAKQVPKSKKHSFLLFMFKEAMSPKKSKSSAAMLSNPKYLDIQLMQMTKILKDSSKVKDRALKQALIVLKDYLKWEQAKPTEIKKSKNNKIA